MNLESDQSFSFKRSDDEFMEIEDEDSGTGDEPSQAAMAESSDFSDDDDGEEIEDNFQSGLITNYERQPQADTVEEEIISLMRSK